MCKSRCHVPIHAPPAPSGRRRLPLDAARVPGAVDSVCSRLLTAYVAWSTRCGRGARCADGSSPAAAETDQGGVGDDRARRAWAGHQANQYVRRQIRRRRCQYAGSYSLSGGGLRNPDVTVRRSRGGVIIPPAGP
ncbi:hypothetical protein HBB16_17380 [Pseudonocardia sp. MCCB 268]|nr:hypothetical protein [Pseudonocardia cytotoxica]